MDKFMVTEIPAEQQVVIDVPEGYLRVTGSMDPSNGDGRLVMTRALEPADPGTETNSEHTIPLLQIHIQSPERAMVIATALYRLAEMMKAWRIDNDVLDEDEDDDCEDCCPGCPHYDVCAGCDDDDEDGVSNG